MAGATKSNSGATQSKTGAKQSKANPMGKQNLLRSQSQPTCRQRPRSLLPQTIAAASAAALRSRAMSSGQVQAAADSAEDNYRRTVVAGINDLNSSGKLACSSGGDGDFEDEYSDSSGWRQDSFSSLQLDSSQTGT